MPARARAAARPATKVARVRTPARARAAAKSLPEVTDSAAGVRFPRASNITLGIKLEPAPADSSFFPALNGEVADQTVAPASVPCLIFPATPYRKPSDRRIRQRIFAVDRVKPSLRLGGCTAGIAYLDCIIRERGQRRPQRCPRWFNGYGDIEQAFEIVRFFEWNSSLLQMRLHVFLNTLLKVKTNDVACASCGIGGARTQRCNPLLPCRSIQGSIFS